MDSWLFSPVRAVLERNNGLPQTLVETEIPERPLFSPVHALPVKGVLGSVFGTEDPAAKAAATLDTAGRRLLLQAVSTTGPSVVRQAWS